MQKDDIVVMMKIIVRCVTSTGKTSNFADIQLAKKRCDELRLEKSESIAAFQPTWLRDDSIALRDLASLSMESGLCFNSVVMVVVTIPSHIVELTDRYPVLCATLPVAAPIARLEQFYLKSSYS